MTKRKLNSFKENENENENKEESSKPEKPIKLSIVVPKTTPYLEADNNGYETDETVLEEHYVPPKGYVPPESSYKRYLRLMKEDREKYDEGYETEKTVILDEDESGNELKGGKKKTIKYIKKTKKTKKTKKSKKSKTIVRKRKTQKKTYR